MNITIERPGEEQPARHGARADARQTAGDHYRSLRRGSRPKGDCRVERKKPMDITAGTIEGITGRGPSSSSARAGAAR